MQKEISLHKVYAPLQLCKVRDVFYGPPGILLLLLLRSGGTSSERVKKCDKHYVINLLTNNLPSNTDFSFLSTFCFLYCLNELLKTLLIFIVFVHFLQHCCYSITTCIAGSHKSFQNLATPVIFSVLNVLLLCCIFETNKPNESNGEKNMKNRPTFCQSYERMHSNF